MQILILKKPNISIGSNIFSFLVINAYLQSKKAIPNLIIYNNEKN